MIECCFVFQLYCLITSLFIERCHLNDKISQEVKILTFVQISMIESQWKVQLILHILLLKYLCAFFLLIMNVPYNVPLKWILFLGDGFIRKMLGNWLSGCQVRHSSSSAVTPIDLVGDNFYSEEGKRIDICVFAHSWLKPRNVSPFLSLSAGRFQWWNFMTNSWRLDWRYDNPALYHVCNSFRNNDNIQGKTFVSFFFWNLMRFPNHCESNPGLRVFVLNWSQCCKFWKKWNLYPNHAASAQHRLFWFMPLLSASRFVPTANNPLAFCHLRQ